MCSHIIFRRIISGINWAAVFCMLTSCATYYKATSTATTKIDTLKSINKYFILRNGVDAYFMENATLSEDKKVISCHLDTLSADHKLHLTKGRGGKMRYNEKEPEVALLTEVHIYIPFDSTAKLNSDYIFPADKIQKMELLEKNKARTTNSYIIGGVGFIIGFLAIAVLMAGTSM